MVSIIEPKVLVLMATYNGSSFVAEQIDSILAQQGVDVDLLICDDGSSDPTPDICKLYADKYHNVTFAVNKNNKGVTANFMDMLYSAPEDGYDYFAFSDQDDYWMPEKLHRAIEAIRAHRDGPRLYYSDVTNTDANLNGGHREYACFAPFSDSINLLLTINWALGCTMVFNSEFLRLIKEFKPERWPRIHDAWIHMIALSCDCVAPCLDESYILRRISGNNVVGSMNFGVLGSNRFKNAWKMLTGDRDHNNARAASALIEGYGRHISHDVLVQLEHFASVEHSLSSRIQCAFESEFRGPFFIENICFAIKMLFGLY